MKNLLLRLPLLFALSCVMAAGHAATTDPVAENMLLLQTDSGGWSKHYRGDKVDYRRDYDEAERAALRAPGRKDDATIDNKATAYEIAYLAQAWRDTGNAAYLAAARRGVEYLLAAQYPNGGWPQYFPDRSHYRHQITYNDDAMARTLQLLQDVAEGREALAALTPEFGDRARGAVARGIDCILATQVRIDDRPAIWAAQYDEISLLPARARAYEPPSLAVSESVGVVRFLMRQPEPTPEIVAAIDAAAGWLDRHRLRGMAMRRIDAPAEETGKDVIIVQQSDASLWARFYDLRNQQPLFVDRQGQPVARFTDMPNERRVGYAWYGTWPESLLSKELPRWRARTTAAGQRGDSP